MKGPVPSAAPEVSIWSVTTATSRLSTRLNTIAALDYVETIKSRTQMVKEIHQLSIKALIKFVKESDNPEICLEVILDKLNKGDRRHVG